MIRVKSKIIPTLKQTKICDVFINDFMSHTYDIIQVLMSFEQFNVRFMYGIHLHTGRNMSQILLGLSHSWDSIHRFSLNKRQRGIDTAKGERDI